MVFIFSREPLLSIGHFKWAEQFLAHYTDAIITMNKEDFDSACQFHLRNNGKVYKNPGVGVDTSNFQNICIDKEKYRNEFNIPKNAFVGIGVGDVVERKNYKCAIKAIYECHNPLIHYIICGNGPQIESLKLFTQELGIESQIHIAGYRKDVRELLFFADFFLFCSKQEGLPRSMMEAMSAGLPCIVSEIRGHIDLIENDCGGKIVPSNDATGFSKAIIDLLNDKDKMQKYSDYNLERIKEFDTNNVYKSLLNIYKDIINH